MKLIVSYGFILLLLGVVITTGYSQESEEDLIKRRQRGIFVYNFIQQIGWPESSDLSTFRIGVLGEDKLYDELTEMAKVRTVRGKKIEVYQFDQVANIQPVEVIYVNKKYNFDIGPIIRKAIQQKTLLISENYNFHSSMINILDVRDNFYYEINEKLLLQMGFKVSETLKENAISSATRWQELFLDSEKSLKNEREKVNQQSIRLKQQNDSLISQSRRLSELSQTINEQLASIEEGEEKLRTLQNRYQLKESGLKTLESQIGVQVSELIEKEKRIESKNEEAKKQDLLLKKQVKELENQSELLRSQKTEISRQQNVLRLKSIQIKSIKNLNFLLGILFMLVIVVSILIYRSYHLKKKSNLQLAVKNKEIESQSKEIHLKNQELEQFAYVASHDLQEPLRTIESFIGLLERKYLEDMEEAARKYMYFINDASNRMNELIKGLLEHSRLGQNVEFKNFDCQEIVSEVLLDLSKLIKESHAAIEIGDLPNDIFGFQSEIRLLFQNLISNAIKFRKPDENPEVRITSKEEEEFWEFQISDNGIGIEDSQYEKIFLLFQRLHNQEAYEGTGIGLTHCRKVAELHGGRIWVKSEKGKGSSFFFTLARPGNLQSPS